MSTKRPSSGTPRRARADEVPGRIKVLIVDDHPLVRDGLAARIDGEPDMVVCGEAESVRSALAHIEAEPPHVVIVDLGLKRSHGLELIKEIKGRKLGTRVLVLSAYREDLFGRRALRLGAHGYVNKQQAQRSVIGAIRAVAAGKRYISDQLAERLLDDAMGASGRDQPADALSDRELQIFELIGEGESTRAIAERLHLSVHTIETHRERIRGKLGLRNGSELVQHAVQWVLESR